MIQKIDYDRNRDRLVRTRDGRLLAGVWIPKDGDGKHVQCVYVGQKDWDGGFISAEAMRLPPESTFEIAAQKARDWAVEHLPLMYACASEDFDLRLMTGPRLGRVAR